MAQPAKTFDNLPEEKRKRVLAEATREFADHGFHQASVNRIVGRLGIAKGSLFKYFGNKEGLFEYLFSHSVAEFKRPLKAIRDNGSGDFFKRMEQTLLAGAAFVDAHPNIYRIYLKMLFNERFPLRERFLGEIRRANAKFLRRLIENGKADGDLPDALDTENAVFILHSTMDRFLQGHAVPSLDQGMPASTRTLQEKARLVTDFIRRGLGVPGRNK